MSQTQKKGGRSFLNNFLSILYYSQPQKIYTTLKKKGKQTFLSTVYIFHFDNFVFVTQTRFFNKICLFRKKKPKANIKKTVKVF